MNFEKLTEYLDSLPGRGIPSVDCIITKGYERVYRHMAGTTDKDYSVPVNGNELYLMFSMTKVITMTALMQLEEMGNLSLEDEVGMYLPAYKDVKVKDIPFGPEESGTHTIKNTLKIWHLVSMQSGLDYNLERPGILRVLKEKGQQATTREIAEAFADTPLNFEPGTRYDYSLSHDVVAAIIEVVSGMKFGDYLKKNIFDPLGMSRTRFAMPHNDDVEGLAQQFIMKEDMSIVPMEQDCCYQLSENYESGGAGLLSCTEDYSKFAEAMANGGISSDGVRIIKAETIEKMKKDLLCEASHNDIEQKMGRYGYGYGCGMQVLLDPKAVNSPAPKGIFGWDGAAGSMIFMDTENKISIVYTMHVRSCGPAYGEIHPTLRDLLY